MINLIRLELKKFKIKGNILALIICSICILGIVCLISFTERTKGNIVFDNYEMAFKMIGSLVNSTFIVFAGVLISKFIIEEYKSKTINLLFTYPISRKKIMMSKVLIISIFTFISIILSSIFIFGSFYIIQSITHTTLGELTIDMISKQFIITVMNALINSIISLVPLYFGLKKKSVPATLITSVLMVSFLYSGSEDINLYSFIAIPLTIMVVGILIVYITIKDIDRKDVIV